MSRPWRRLFRFTSRSPGEIRADVREEFAFHLDARTRDLIDQGWTEADARQQAAREFGRADAGAAACARQAIWLERRRGVLRAAAEFRQDVRLGDRLLRRNPTFAAAVILTMSVAIGGNTAVFSIANALFFAPTDVASPETVVRLHPGERRISWTNAQDLLERTAAFSDLALEQRAAASLDIGPHPVRVEGARVTTNYFTLLGAHAAMGRTLLPSDASRDVVVLSDRTWRVRFGADASILGRTVMMDGRPHEVVGVMAPAFRGVAPPGLAAGFWRPLEVGADAARPSRTQPQFEAIARLRPGIARAHAAAEVQAAARVLAAEQSDLPRVFTSITLHGIHGLDAFTGVAGTLLPVFAFLALLTVASGFVLLIACANVAGLLLSRSAARRREFALRRALGAGRGRLVRQMLTECLLLAAGGCAGGIALASLLVSAAADAVRRWPMPVALDFAIDRRVLLYSVLLSLASALLFGAAPAREAGGVDPISGLKGDDPGSRRQRVRRLLVAGQVGACTLLLVWSGLFLRSVFELNQVKPGFDASGILLAHLEWIGQTPDAADRAQLAFADLQARIAAAPGVTSAGMALIPPLTFRGRENFRVSTDGEPRRGQGVWVSGNRTTPGWFETMRIPLLAGRDFRWDDRSGAPPVIVVSDTLSRQVWSGGAVGRRLTFHGEGDRLVTAEVVGVVSDIRQWTLGEDPQPTVYMPSLQRRTKQMTLHVRTADPAATAEVIRRIVAGVAGLTSDLEPMSSAVAVALLPSRVGALLTMLFGVVAALLATIGVYGLVAFTAVQRTRETAIRVAMGAAPVRAVLPLVRESAWLAASGLALGALLAAASAPVLGGLIVNVSPYDPTVIGAAAVGVLGTTVTAALVPAVRAARIDPAAQLRAE